MSDKATAHMSTDARNALITDHLQKLIKSVAGPNITPKQQRHLEQIARKHIRHPNFLSTKSHEVTQTLNALVDRFQQENMAPFGQAIKELSTKLVEDPAWQDHDQTDVQWSLLDFLLSMTNAPIQNVRRNRQQMDQCRLSALAAVEASTYQAVVPNIVEADTDWVSLLSEDFLEGPTPGDSSDTQEEQSEESDAHEISGSVCPEDLKTTLKPKDMANVYKNAMNNVNPCVEKTYVPELARSGKSGRSFQINAPINLALVSPIEIRSRNFVPLPPLQPPQLFTQHTQSVRDENVLPQLIHSHWWRHDIQIHTKPPDSDPLSNFAISYPQFLNKYSLGLVHYPLPNTTTERCLIREILFMFVSPVSCCFFVVDEERRIHVRQNVSICSVTAEGLKGTLEAELVPALEDMMQLRQTVDKLTLRQNGENIIGTLECFANGLRDLVRPIKKALLAYEERMLSEEPVSLIHFIRHMNKHFRMLQLLRFVSSKAVLPSGPPHLMCAYLLSQLYQQTQLHVPHQKLAIALLLVSLNTYCNIFDGLWRRAKLEDRQAQFIVERWVPEGEDATGEWEARVHIRQRRLEEEESEENHQLFKKLHSCPFYRLLLEHSLTSIETQDLLASVNLLGDMLATTNENNSRSLYEELHAQLFVQLRVYGRPTQQSDGDTQMANSHTGKEQSEQKAFEQKVLNSVGTIRNPDLLALLTQPITKKQQERDKPQDQQRRQPPVQAVQVLERLESATRLQVKDVMSEALREILLRRQSLANMFAIKAMTVDLQLGESARFLRHVLLLEADHLLRPYYTRLFRDIEAGLSWAQVSVLNMELYELLMPQYAQMAGRASVRIVSQVRSTSTKVYEAVEAIELVFDFFEHVQRIVTPSNLQTYNAVWRLMLKVKWAAWKLENMVFIRRPHRDMYKPLDMLGLTVRRLEILRFWLMYLINSLHTHIMQVVSHQFEPQIAKCHNIRELSSLHEQYMLLLSSHCLLTEETAAFRIALEQLFHVVFVLDLEWTSCSSYLVDSHPLALDVSSDDDEDNPKCLQYLALNQVVEIEMTYIRCHQTLAEILNNLVYKHDHHFLTALESAINTSVPY
ncbi:GL13307 [Drosophila persimilis]|uniref:Gamma-tubulin complex component n=1 Tax=Drosophila persimilis TaxID=7234 RepID=B4H2X4_DROPE|nr:uncharacterized protein LOC6600207 [Drosophila persimilis]EDW30806.1 GL13307 [Drosophila persimilis]